MTAQLFAKVLSFIVFAAVVGGATAYAYQYLEVGELQVRGLAMKPVEPTLNVAPGVTVSAGFVLRNGGTEAEPVTFTVTGPAGLVGTGPDGVTVPAEDGVGVWVDLTPAPGATGEQVVRVTAATTTEPVRRATTTLTLRMVEDGRALVEGEAGRVAFTARTADGTLFNANMPGYIEAPFPRYEFYRDSGNLTIPTGPGTQILEPVWRGVVGMRVGETRSVIVPPEQAFGPARIDESVPRVSQVERTFVLPVQPITRQREIFDQYIEVTQQGDPANYTVGTAFRSEQGGNDWRMLITASDETGVTYIPQPEVGERFTLQQHPAWAEGSVVTSSNATAVVFYTTPTVQPGEPFTFFSYWPNMSVVERVDEDFLFVKNNPEEGFTFTVVPGPTAQAQGQQPRDYRVDEVTDTVIKQSYADPHPLAGRTLIFNMRLLAINS